MKTLAMLAMVVGCLGRVRAADAVVTGSIFGPGSESFPIAVVPLKNVGGDADGSLGTRFARVLSRDLDLSGYFRLLDPKTFIEDPQTSGTTAADIDFVGWATIGAQALVKGTVNAAGDAVTIEVRLFDVPGRHDVPPASRRFTGGRADLARMAHKTADGILEFLTGERGPFDSAIALVSTRGGRLKEVYRFTFDMDDPVKLSDERSLVVTPRWRADGRAILFTSYREHVPRLFQLDLGTRQVTRLVGGPGLVLDGAWSPDGSKLLVSRDRPPAGSRQPRVGARWPALGVLLGAYRVTAGLRHERRRHGTDTRLAHWQLQHLAGVVAEGRSHRLCDPRERRLPDRGHDPGRVQRADDHLGGQQRESLLGTRRSLSRLLLDARGPASSLPCGPRRQDPETIDARCRG